MPEFETVLYEVADGVAVLTLNRPERRNAMNATLNREIVQALEAARDDAAVRAIVVTGAGKGFCSGADLSVFQGIPTPDEIYAGILTSYQPMMGLITSMKKPILAAVNGAAAGAGASLALACDLRVMGEDAFLMMAFSNIGLVPDAGATWFLARQIGYSRAYEIAAEARRVPASECLTLGLTNRVVESDVVVETAVTWAKQLAKRPTLALGLTKHALTNSLLKDLTAAIEFEARLQRQTIVSEDHREGVMAFMERREPNYKGK